MTHSPPLPTPPLPTPSLFFLFSNFSSESDYRHIILSDSCTSIGHLCTCFVLRFLIVKKSSWCPMILKYLMWFGRAGTRDLGTHAFNGGTTGSLSNMRTYLRTCAPSVDSDQPAHSCSLTRTFTRRILDNQGGKVSLCGQRRLRSNSSNAQADLSRCCTHISEGTSSQIEAYIIFRSGMIDFVR